MNLKRCLFVCMVLSFALLNSGCDMFGWAAQSIVGTERTIDLKAQYTGLTGKTVAIVISADDQTLFNYPGAVLAISRAIGTKLTADIPGIKIINPEQIVQFQRTNPYWNTLPYNMLITKLHTERLLMIDLVQYNTHEPGNKHVWRGVAVANVGVAEAEAKDPDNLAYSQTVRASFPENQPVGVLDSDDQTIQLGLVRNLAGVVINLFIDHQETIK